MAASSRDMNIPVLVTLFTIATILVYVIVVATQAWFRWEFNREFQIKVVEQPHWGLERLRDEQSRQIAEGPVPLDEAMRMTVSLYRGPDAPRGTVPAPQVGGDDAADAADAAAGDGGGDGN
jgi:hypothetical protein